MPSISEKLKEKFGNKVADATWATGKSTGKGMKSIGDALSKQGSITKDESMAGQLARKLGASGDTSLSVAKVAGKTSKTVRDFADEHGGKVAAATAAGLGALGLAKLLRKKKNTTAEEAVQQNV